MNDTINNPDHTFIKAQQRKKLFYTLKRHACKSNHIDHILPLLARNHLPPALQRQYLGNMLHLACRYGNIDIVKLFFKTDYKKALTIQHISWALLIVSRESRYLGHEEKRIKKSDDCLKIYHLILQTLTPQILSQVFEYMIVDMSRASLPRQIYQHLDKNKCMSIFKQAVENNLTHTVKWLIPEISCLLSSGELIHLLNQFPQYQQIFINALSETKLLNAITQLENQNHIGGGAIDVILQSIIKHLSYQQFRMLLEKLIELKKYELIELLFQQQQFMKLCLEQLSDQAFIDLIIILVINNRLGTLKELCNFQDELHFIKILHQAHKVNLIFELAMSAGYLDLVGFLFCCLLKSASIIDEKQMNHYLGKIFNFMILHNNHELMIYLLIKMNRMTRGWWEKLMFQLSGQVKNTPKNPLTMVKECTLDKFCIWLSSVRILVLPLGKKSHFGMPHSISPQDDILPIPRQFRYHFCLSPSAQKNDFLRGFHQILRLTISKSISSRGDLFKGVKDKSGLPLSALLCWCVYQSRYDLAQQLIHLGADPFYPIGPSHYNAFHYCLNANQIYELLSIYIENKHLADQTQTGEIHSEEEKAQLLNAKLEVVGYFRNLEYKTNLLGSFMRAHKCNNKDYQFSKSIIQTTLKAISIQNLHELLNNAKFTYRKNASSDKQNTPIIQQIDLALKATAHQDCVPEEMTQ